MRLAWAVYKQMAMVRLQLTLATETTQQTMPALDVHHPKSSEPAFEHVYVNVPDEDHCTIDDGLTCVYAL
jgi:hypothetical protein